MQVMMHEVKPPPRPVMTDASRTRDTGASIILTLNTIYTKLANTAPANTTLNIINQGERYDT